MTNTRVPRSEVHLILGNAMARAFEVCKAHPTVARSRRGDCDKVLKALQAMVKEDAADLLRNERKSHKDAFQRKEAETPSRRRFSQLSDEEKKKTLEHFDLNSDETFEEAGVDIEEVINIAMDEIGEDLEELNYWKRCGEQVLRIVGEGRKKRVDAVDTTLERLLSTPEMLWHDMLEFQEPNAWSRCVQAARLAGRLWLFDLEEGDQYSRLCAKAKESEVHAFPERFFGALYSNRDAIKTVGHRLRPLYERHREVVVAAVQYALHCRNVLLYYGQGKQNAIEHRGDGEEQLSPVTSETKADSLIRSHFPWLDARRLGAADNICKWRSFQNLLNIFVEAYNHFWNDVGVYEDEAGNTCFIPPENRTWDFVTEQLCHFKDIVQLKRNLALRDQWRNNLRARRPLVSRSDAADGAAATRAAAVVEAARAEVVPPWAVAVAPMVGMEVLVDSQLDSVSEGGNGDGTRELVDESDDASLKLSELGAPANGGNNGRRLTRSQVALAAVDQPKEGADSDDTVSEEESDPQVAADDSSSDEEEEEEAPPPLLRKRITRTATRENAIRKASLPLRSAPATRAVSKKRKATLGAKASVRNKKKEKVLPPPKKRAKTTKTGPIPGSRIGRRATRGNQNGDSDPIAAKKSEDAADGPRALAATSPPPADNGTLQGDAVGRKFRYLVRVLERAAPGAATCLSVAFPKRGLRVPHLDSLGSLAGLLRAADEAAKVDLVATISKKVSGTLYAVEQLTTAPHQTHLGERTAAIQVAAMEAGITALNLQGNVSFVHPKVSCLVPGTSEYSELGLDGSVLGAVQAGVFEALLEGVMEICDKGHISAQKAKELNGGNSRNTFNFGVGTAGHAYQHGALAPLGEFAETSMMNQDLVDKHFPDGGRCLGVLFEALGRAQKAIEDHLHLEERPDKDRNSKYAGELGRMLHKPGCEAGECLFLSIECSKSPLLKAMILDKLAAKLKKAVPGQSVNLHVDSQNPEPNTKYARVVVATWIVYIEVEGELCPIQISAILCNRASVCARKINNRSVVEMLALVRKGEAKFQAECGNVRYEDDGLGVLSCCREMVMTYLQDEPRKSGELGCWVGHLREGPSEGAARYKLVKGRTVKYWLKSVGDEALRKDDAAKGTSDVAEILRSNRLFGQMVACRACPNKFAMHSSDRHAAKLVVDRFHLKEQHVWQLFYCKNQHWMIPAIFVAKCLSLVHQWDEVWASSPFGNQWLEAADTNGHDGLLASVFMNMTPHVHTNFASSLLKRATSAHICDHQVFTPEGCQRDVELLRQFGDSVVQSTPLDSTVSLLSKSMGKKGTLGPIMGFGSFTNPQIITGIFLWGLQPIPCWRAAECPILDLAKKHYVENSQELLDEEKEEVEEEPRLSDAMAAKLEKDMKKEAMNRCLVIVAHILRTSSVSCENHGCEGIRTNEVMDYLLLDMVSWDLRPTESSNPYHPEYALWRKYPGPEACWEEVPIRQVWTELRMWRL